MYLYGNKQNKTELNLKFHLSEWIEKEEAEIIKNWKFKSPENYTENIRFTAKKIEFLFLLLRDVEDFNFRD